MRIVALASVLVFLLVVSIGFSHAETTHSQNSHTEWLIYGTSSEGTIASTYADDGDERVITEEADNGNAVTDVWYDFNFSRSTLNISKVELTTKGQFESGGPASVDIMYWNYTDSGAWNDTGDDLTEAPDTIVSTLCSNNATCTFLMNYTGDFSHIRVRYYRTTLGIPTDNLRLDVVLLTLTYDNCYPANNVVWDINETDYVRCENEDIVLNGNLSVNGNLTFQESTLSLNPGKDNQYNITVNSGGNLSVNMSNISSLSGNDYIFRVLANTNITLNNSYVSYVGNTGGINGVNVNSHSNIFYNTTFSNSHTGIQLVSSGSNLIDTCNFTDNTNRNIDISSGRHNRIVNNNFTGRTTGSVNDDIYLEISDNNTILDNRFDGKSQSEVAIYLVSGSDHNNITGNNFTGYVGRTIFGVVHVTGSVRNNVSYNNFSRNYNIPLSVYTNANYNNFTDNEFYNNSHQTWDIDTSDYNFVSRNYVNNSHTGSGVYLCAADWNNVTLNTFNYTYAGIGFCANSDNNRFSGNVIDYATYGVYEPDTATDNVTNSIYENMTITNVRFGVWARGSENITLSNVSISNATVRGIQLDESNITGYSVLFYETPPINFWGWNFTMDNQSQSTSYPDSSTHKNVSSYISVTNYNDVAWIGLNMTWSDSALYPYLTESTIRLQRYQPTGWLHMTDFIDTDNNKVAIMKITSFSVFAPMAVSGVSGNGGGGGGGGGTGPYVNYTTYTDWLAGLDDKEFTLSYFDWLIFLILAYCIHRIIKDRKKRDKS